jgi:signal transduction histidine kinase
VAELLPPPVQAEPEQLPSDAKAVVLRARDADSARATLAQIWERAPRSRVAVLLDVAPDAAHEADLLDAGVTLVLDVAHPLALRRLRALTDGLRVPGGDSDGKRQRALSIASTLLETINDEAETFQFLVEIVARELNSQRVSLLQVEQAAGVLVMRAAVGIPAEVIAVARPRIGEGIAGTCAALGEPLFIDDHSSIRSGASDLAAFVPSGVAKRELPMSLTVPLKVKGEVVGVVNVTNRADERPYSRQDIEFIGALMGHAGYLLENAQLLGNLRAERAFNERIIDTITDPLAVVDDRLRIVRANRRFTDQFEFAEGSLLERLGLDDDQRVALVAELVDPQVTQSERLAGWELAESIFDLRVNGFSDGGASRFLIFMHDVTVRRQMERRLVAAEKMASLGVLSAGVAHEINNPIAFVKANARHAKEYINDLLELLDAWRDTAHKAGLAAAFMGVLNQERDLDLAGIREDVTSLTGDMVKGVERVERIVTGLKSFAHPDTQKAMDADVAELLDNALLLTQGKWKYKLDVVRDFGALAPLSCLPTQLEQVFMNLIVNAAQAAEKWGTLRISVEDSPEGVEVAFADDCGGVPDTIVDRIFEPFFTTKDIGEGSGMGLAISYNIIEGHGGRLQVETEAGRGTTFRINIPRGEAGRPLVIKQASRFRI